MEPPEGERKDAGRRPAGSRSRSAAGTPQTGRRAAAAEGPDGGFLPELLRRGLSLGFSGLFMTEEAVRRALGDKVPRDWLEFFVAQSERTRGELVQALSREFGRVLARIEPVDVLRQLLDGQTIEVTAQVRLQKPRRGAGAAVAARPRRKPGARA